MGSSSGSKVVEYGYIYAIGYDGCVKVGLSATSAEGRLRTMQTGNAAVLTLVAQAYVANYKLIETALHRELKTRGKWIRGEWYSLTMEEASLVISGVGEDIVAKQKAERKEGAEASLEFVKNRGCWQ